MIAEKGLVGIIAGIAHVLANAGIAAIARQPERRNLEIDLQIGDTDPKTPEEIVPTTAPARQDLGGTVVTEKDMRVVTEEHLDGIAMLGSLGFGWIANYTVNNIWLFFDTDRLVQPDLKRRKDLTSTLA